MITRRTQILGDRKAEISKRIDIVAAALFQEAQVEDSTISAIRRRSAARGILVQMAAQAWSAGSREIKRTVAKEPQSVPS
jgi:hypothetical protein